MDNVTPAKRARTDGADDNATSSRHASSESARNYEQGDVWLEDGNVVLVAEGTAFKVHQSVLSRNSEVFRDMFTVPQPSDAETFAGAPVVHLQDSKSMLKYVLAALFDGCNT